MYRVDWKEAEESNWRFLLENHCIDLEKFKRFWQFEFVLCSGKWRGGVCRSVKLSMSRRLHSSVSHLNLIFESIIDRMSKATSSLILEMLIEPQPHGLMAVPSIILFAITTCCNNS